MTDPAQNLMDMTLFAPSERDEVGTSSSGSAFTTGFDQVEETLTYEARQCGTHYLLVFSADLSSAGPYELEAQIGQASCVDADEFADACNHDQFSAELFAWNSKTYALELCGGGEDWVKHTGQASQILAEVNVTAGEASGVRLEIWDAEGNELTEAAVPDGEASLLLDYTFPDDDMYYFRVVNDGDERVAYQLFVTQ